MSPSSLLTIVGRKKALRHSNRGFTLIEIMIVVLIIGILLAIAVPNFVKARDSARTKSCVSNLQQIQAAKQQWAMDTKAAGTATPSSANLFGSTAYIRSIPVCPAGTVAYVISPVDTDQACSNAAANPTHILQ